MSKANDKAEKHIGETMGLPNHVHDLVHDLSTRLDAVWRYNQYMENANKDTSKKEMKLWSDLLKSELKTVERLKVILHKQLGKTLK